MAEEAQLDFVCDVADDVPGRVVVNGQRLRQVLLNLLGNAIKFTETGQRDALTLLQRAKVGVVLGTILK